MMKLHVGERVRARVLGFLPGRKALLDLDGRTLVAWTDLPLAIGRVVSAVVEDSPEGPTLRVREGNAPSGPETEDARHGEDRTTLPSLIDGTAAEFGLDGGPDLFRTVLRELREAVPALEKGPVPLDLLRDEIATILAARARGLPSSRRALAALRSGGGARMGRGLGRLVDELAGLGRLLVGPSAREGAVRARRLESYFLDLAEAGREGALIRALRRCGYGHEARIAAAGRDGWGDGEGAEGADLKGELIDVDRWLRTLSSRDLPRRSGPARRGVFRSSAWVGRILDTIEAIQVNNLPGPPDPEGASDRAWQIPVSVREERGTLFLLLRGAESRVWLDLEGREVLSLRVGADGGPLSVLLPEGDGETIDGPRLASLLPGDPAVVAVRVAGGNGSVPRVDFVL